MRRAGRSLRASALLVIVLGCRPAESPSERARRELAAMNAREARFVADAPPCAVPAPADTTGWRPAVAHGRRLPFSLPPGFAEDTTVQFFHGGTRWAEGEREFTVSMGHWGPTSFAPTRTARCRADLGGRPVLVITSATDGGRYSVSFWPFDPGNSGEAYRTYGPLYSGTSARQRDERLFWTIARHAIGAAWHRDSLRSGPPGA